MKTANQTLLAELGLSWLSRAQREKMLPIVEEELQLRIGRILYERIGDEKSEELERIEDPYLAEEWLSQNEPKYIEIVEECKASMKNDLANVLNGKLK